jgi:DNA modification methylase
MIINADCLTEMRLMPPNSVSAIVTDPPYGLGFVGKDWDAGLPHKDIWAEALRICKPGAHLLAFGGTRTYHRLTCAIEDAGWQIRDCLMWIYGSGFPKSHNHFGLEGYGTALKPAYEPIIMAMKPCDGTFKENVEKWQQGGINIDGCRVSYQSEKDKKMGQSSRPSLTKEMSWAGKFKEIDRSDRHELKGRWPANVLFDEEAAKMLDEQSGNLKSGALNPYKRKSSDYYSGSWPDSDYKSNQTSGGASRFFYCAKASSNERNEGLDDLPDVISECNLRSQGGLPKPENEFKTKNNHPTVKPLKLMEYLIKLVMPPNDGLLLDPFAGSGTTILAAQRLGYNAIGIEKSSDYCAIAEQRITNDRSMTIEKDNQQMTLHF